MAQDDHAYDDALSAAGVATLNVLAGMEVALRQLHPLELPTLRQNLTPYGEALDKAVPQFRAAEPPEHLASFHERFLEGASRAQRAVALFLETPPPQEVIARVLASMRALCRALESLYAVHRLPPLSRFFVEPAFHDRIDELDPEPPAGISVGLHNAGTEEDLDRRGGFCLYVPETYDGSAEWPLVVALHGGSGSGRDFVWTWLREARGRRFLLLAPTAVGATWSMVGPDVDAGSIGTMIDYISQRWRVKKSSVLLTGLSDGGTYSLLCGTQEDSRFTALAPVSGVLHPAVLGSRPPEQLTGRRVYLVHGARDWLFPVTMARLARDMLTKAGVDLVYREIEDLSHTYPREENGRILEWFDPSLALPGGSATDDREG